jgi:hypothetical protein
VKLAPVRCTHFFLHSPLLPLRGRPTPSYFDPLDLGAQSLLVFRTHRVAREREGIKLATSLVVLGRIPA